MIGQVHISSGEWKVRQHCSTRWPWSPYTGLNGFIPSMLMHRDHVLHGHSLTPWVMPSLLATLSPKCYELMISHVSHFTLVLFYCVALCFILNILSSYPLSFADPLSPFWCHSHLKYILLIKSLFKVLNGTRPRTVWNYCWCINSSLTVVFRWTLI